ncbi:NUDIX domain-containing protein [Uliginosibacterium sp. 31-12]|uniref:NUDIX hydrolase n=1 Tax=Uliginosibacterium sp. 31-12 TaxID=3062781 RepID=UPI0026E1C486|nr:NUDIX domain-containing protein [Uliginosibacterium sp. 31-12]MDO6388200.1 NUDIX domain-containing protein [Uliginosibacterium sp. 31-12]
MPQKAIICTVDVVLLCLRGAVLNVALWRRERAPFEGSPALPGGYIHPEEDVDTLDAASRMLREKTGIASPYLEQLGTFSGASRDPRGWSISIAYYALLPAELIEQEPAPGLVLQAVEQLKGLPFDHKDIVQAAVQRVRNKSSYSSLPVYLCGEQFTLPRLQAVYEAVLGEPINKVSFRRKMEELDMLEAVEGAMETGRANRPAQLYRLKHEFQQCLSVSPRSLTAAAG